MKLAVPQWLLILLPLAALASEPATLPDQAITKTTPADDAEVPLIPVKSSEHHDFLQRDPDQYSTVAIASGFSAHRPMYVLPPTWSRDYTGRHIEIEFKISFKQRLLDTNLYFGYTQKSFWQMYHKHESSPFRESNYNLEVFYRYTPDPIRFNHFGADLGIEHESNGRDIPYSRNWNRLYVAPFQAKGKYLAYLKI